MNICYTGGGTAGHIFPIFPIDHELVAQNSSIKRFFIGRKNNKEQAIVEKEGIEFIPIESGKLRRYFSIQNFFDLFKVIFAFFQAIIILHKRKPNLLFSKGGYVTVPVVCAAKVLGIPIVCHESDATLGLANTIAIRFASCMCIAYEEVKESIKKKYHHKCVVTGVPTRLQKGEYGDGKKYPSPLIAFFGGSQGAIQINNLVLSNIDELTKQAYVVHQTGINKGNIAPRDNYEAHEFIEKEYIDILGQADIVISRSGATSLADYIEMEVPSILIPLGKDASRGDQILNARYLEKRGGAIVLSSERELIPTIKELLRHRDKLDEMKLKLRHMHSRRAETLIASIILDTVE